MRRLAPWLAMLALASAGCAKRQMPPAPLPVVVPDPVSPWPGVLLRAQRLADEGRFRDADRVLGEYAVAHEHTLEGAEADFWLALFKADPSNNEVTVRDQLVALDTYLHGGPTMPRYAEALILRRLVETTDSARAMIVAVRASAQARERAKADEVKRLSDELEKTAAELERIRRRLAPRVDDRRPPPPDPNRPPPPDPGKPPS
jgi:hypothetical protein